MQSGYSKHPVETPAEIKLPTKTWSNKIGRILLIRELHLKNNDFDDLKVTKNQIIMDLAMKYVEGQNLKKEILALINQIRI